MTSCGVFPSGDFRPGSGTKATTHVHITPILRQLHWLPLATSTTTCRLQDRRPGFPVLDWSGDNNFAPFCADKMSMETEKCPYLTVILPNCYSSEEVKHQALNPLIVKPFI